jgi:hypothetical protein
MTISEQKALEEILKALEGQDSVFLIGCTECATVTQVGGEDQLVEMKAKLEEAGKKITGMVVADPGCHLLGLKKTLREHAQELEDADALLTLSCGTGCQTAAEAVKREKPTYTGTNTLFLGCVERFGVFSELCSACADCTLDRTGTICTVTRCAKGLQNGPCGGTTAEGKCEVDPEQPCAWYLVHEVLGPKGLESLRAYVPPKGHDRYHPRKRVIERERGGKAA